MGFKEFASELRVGVVGFSDEDFIKSEAEVVAYLEQGLIDLGVQSTEYVKIVSGLTDMGVPKIAYKYADENNMETVGITANEAKKYDLYNVDEMFFVGEKFGEESTFFLDYIDVLIKIGGGSQSTKEYKAFTGPKVEYELGKGTFAGFKFSEESASELEEFCKKNKIPNHIKKDDFHVTVLFSRKDLTNYRAKGKVRGTAKPKSFELFGEESNVLVIALDSPFCVRRHKKLMDRHGATYDFDEYKPHVTLSYDISDGKKPSNKLLTELPPSLQLVQEYQEAIDL